MNNDFQEFEKIARWSRTIVVTEKLDGTNASICIGEDGSFQTGSRNRWITPEDDNYGFSRWAHESKDELMLLGPGRHFGEWWGAGIQRRYGLEEKRFSLFNSGRWFDLDACADERIAGKMLAPACCRVVPVLVEGPNDQRAIDATIDLLRERGSVAAPGFMKPEGIVIYHAASRTLYKKTLEKDEVPKGLAARMVA